MYKLERFNPAKRFLYEIVNGKRVGRGYYIKSIICGKGGRCCTSEISKASKFHLGRTTPYQRPNNTKEFKEFMEEFGTFFERREY